MTWVYTESRMPVRSGKTASYQCDCPYYDGDDPGPFRSLKKVSKEIENN